MEYKTTSPVGIVIFKREDKARKLYEILKQVKPTQLFIIADGPRYPDEEKQCMQTRAVFDSIEWNCKVYRNYSEYNLGCCIRPYTGFNWVFENVERAILLEDDCVPSVDFFRFCDELLEKYKDDTRVMQICGTNLLGKWDCMGDSYFFVQWASCWGWASWARAWKLFDINMKAWDHQRVKQLVKQRLGKRVYDIRKQVFDEHKDHLNDITAWDHQWSFARTINSGLSITPSVNLVTNIGFGNDATHTNDMSETSIPIYKMKFPLSHPKCILPDTQFDIEMTKLVYNARTIPDKILRKVKKYWL